MTIAVIILNYNSHEDCRRCVADLRGQTGVRLDIIVVDNASPRQGEQQAIAELCRSLGCTLMQSPDNRGYNAGNNLGLRLAAERGHLLALIANPDMRFPQADAIALMAAHMAATPHCVVCGPDVRGLDDGYQSPMQRDGNWRQSFGWMKDTFGRTKPQPKGNTPAWTDDPTTSHPCHKVSGCCLMVSIPFMQQIGYFDEGVFLYCEEAILSRQVERAGRQMYYLATARVTHAHVASQKGDPTVRFRHWLSSRKHFIRHYSGDHWLGRHIAILSWQLYALTFTTKYKLHRK